MYQITILNNVGGRDVFQYEDRGRFETDLASARQSILSSTQYPEQKADDMVLSLSDDFTRSVTYAPAQAIAVLAWDLKQAIRGNVKEQITILAAQGAAQMEASPPGAVTPPLNRHTRRKAGKGK